ncbi:hypothetical protein EFR01_42080 [Sinorhizobium fredii]|nr:hypothetical protein EFR01_42080 [Sinorhizobium fredii]GLS06421.1 hypothetical protein GCM10007864_00450 [Sinorhizobium fredii]
MAFGAAKIDTAYAGIEATIGVVDAFKAKIVAAMESGVDRTKIQGELEQLKQQAVSIATTASFSDQNWLNTDIADIYDQSNSGTLTTGFVRQGSSVRVTFNPVLRGRRCHSSIKSNGSVRGGNYPQLHPAICMQGCNFISSSRPCAVTYLTVYLASQRLSAST